MAEQLKGALVAKAIVGDLARRVERLRDGGLVPTLAMLRVGERADNLSYERGATRRAEQAGIEVRRVCLEEACSQSELEEAIGALNDDAGVHGILMLRPLPPYLDEHAACQAIAAAKDVDCATDASMLHALTGHGAGFVPCTAEACLSILDHYGIELEGAEVTVIGRSLVIGKPVSMMAQARNATVTMCHTRTRDLAAHCRCADVLIVGAGHPKTVGASCVRAGQVVIDVGINWDESEGRLVGDVDYDEVEPLVGAITPVPGGVGAVTSAVLCRHVVEAAEEVYHG